MKILVIGGTGAIGAEVAQYFSQEHQVIIASRKSDDFSVDLSSRISIEQLFEKTGMVDAIVCTAGEAKWGNFYELTEADYFIGIESKLMGQVNLVRIGSKHLSEGGSITLTTGILADDPVIKTTSAAMVNGGIHSFVQAAALELKNGIRLNAVSTGVVENAYKKYQGYFPGHAPIPMKKMLRGYIRSVEGKGNGSIIRIYD